MVMDSVSSPHSREAYRRSLDDFFEWRPAGAQFTKATVGAWKAKLESDGYSPATVNQRLSAIRKLAAEAADNGMLDSSVAAAVAKVKGAKRHGVRSGNWLTRDQAQRTLLSPELETMKGKRDRALLAVLFGCGLRRSEACALTFAHIQQREGRWCIVDLVGKHQRVRTIPMPAWVKSAIDRWAEAAALTDGRVFRAVDKAGKMWGSGITPKVVRCIVVEHAAVAGAERFSAHDARRTFAKLCRSTGGDLEQIQLLLGHASIQTTERYLGTTLELVDAANDSLKLQA
jgi:site-specific recombinase XerD